MSCKLMVHKWWGGCYLMWWGSTRGCHMEEWLVQVGKSIIRSPKRCRFAFQKRKQIKGSTWSWFIRRQQKILLCHHMPTPQFGSYLLENTCINIFSLIFRLIINQFCTRSTKITILAVENNFWKNYPQNSTSNAQAIKDKRQLSSCQDSLGRQQLRPLKASVVSNRLGLTVWPCWPYFRCIRIQTRLIYKYAVYTT